MQYSKVGNRHFDWWDSCQQNIEYFGETMYTVKLNIPFIFLVSQNVVQFYTFRFYIRINYSLPLFKMFLTNLTCIFNKHYPFLIMVCETLLMILMKYWFGSSSFVNKTQLKCTYMLTEIYELTLFMYWPYREEFDRRIFRKG